jgi:hypothetical protein
MLQRPWLVTYLTPSSLFRKWWGKPKDSIYFQIFKRTVLQHPRNKQGLAITSENITAKKIILLRSQCRKPSSTSIFLWLSVTPMGGGHLPTLDFFVSPFLDFRNTFYLVFSLSNTSFGIVIEKTSPPPRDWKRKFCRPLHVRELVPLLTLFACLKNERLLVNKLLCISGIKRTPHPLGE